MPGCFNVTIGLLQDLLVALPRAVFATPRPGAEGTSNISVLLSESQGQNLAVTGLNVPCSLDSGLRAVLDTPGLVTWPLIFAF